MIHLGMLVKTSSAIATTVAFRAQPALSGAGLLRRGKSLMQWESAS